MKNPTESEFYDRLNQIDEDKGIAIAGLCLAALSGLIIGIMIGYFAGIWF